MHLLFLRHGIAIDREDPDCPPNDFDRALTKAGRKKMAEEARGMLALGIDFDCILSSPLVRARETAELVVEAYSNRANVELAEVLEPGMTSERLLRYLAKACSAEATVLLAGHEPDFSRAVARLGFGVETETFSLKKGGLACVELSSTSPGARGRLLWLLTPALLRAAAGDRR